VKTPSIVLVVAVAENGVIGRKGDLPWRIPGDLRHFKAVTMGKPVVMGRKTYDSIGKPLPGRPNIVITRDRNFRAEGVRIASGFEEVLEAAREEARRIGASEIAIIGGVGLFTHFLPMAARIELTEVHAKPDGDVKFPEFNRSKWNELRRDGPHQGPNDDHPYTIVTLERR
jgi:dihydrofolate reductase